MYGLNSVRFHFFAIKLALAVLLLLAGSTELTAASPSLSVIMPRGVQRGAEQVVTFQGRRLADAEEVFFYQKGVAVTKIEPVNNNAFKAHLKISADCKLGEHVAQVRCKSGLTEYSTFYVGPFAAIDEKEPNSDFTTPQKIDYNVTVHGVVQREDVDYFAVEAKKGQRISVEVEALRLATTYFDPYVAVLDKDRFELAIADDTPLVHPDSALSVIAPEDGTYIIEMRESSYQGSGASRYRLHVGTFLRPMAAYPPGGKVGTKTEVTMLGDVAGPRKQAFDLPTEIIPNYGLEVNDGQTVAPTPLPFRLSEMENVLEVEPNNTVKTATPSAATKAFNGVIQQTGDEDWFQFTAKKGQVFEVECYARRLHSALDPVMDIYYANGKYITRNDDARGLDSYVRFTVPADGEYAIKIYDQLGRGGEDFVYRVELQSVAPELVVSIPRIRRYSQFRQQIVVPRGGHFANLINVTRRNFGGEITFEADKLPEGVSMQFTPMAANMSQIPMLFSAAEDAPLGGRLVDLQGRLTDKSKGISGGFKNTADYARYNNSVMWTRDVFRLPVVVVEALPFSIEIVQPSVPIVQNGTMNLKIIAHKAEGFDEPIRVEFPFRPPGIGANSYVDIPKGKSEIDYPITANGNARLGKWSVYALASADVGGTATITSQFVDLEVVAPFVKVTLQRAAVEQGEKTQILARLEHDAEFTGEAKVVLKGLPPKVTAPEVTLTKEAQELVFEVATDPKTPPGNHKSVFSQVEIVKDGAPIVYRAGGTQLRVDKPLPKVEPKKEEKPEKPVAKKEEPKKPVEKPLSRLEKLRLQAKKSAEKK